MINFGGISMRVGEVRTNRIIYIHKVTFCLFVCLYDFYFNNQIIKKSKTLFLRIFEICSKAHYKKSKKSNCLVCFQNFYLFIYFSIFLFIYLFIHLFIYLSIYLLEMRNQSGLLALIFIHILTYPDEELAWIH